MQSLSSCNLDSVRVRLVRDSSCLCIQMSLSVHLVLSLRDFLVTGSFVTRHVSAFTCIVSCHVISTQFVTGSFVTRHVSVFICIVSCHVISTQFVPGSFVTRHVSVFICIVSCHALWTQFAFSLVSQRLSCPVCEKRERECTQTEHMYVAVLLQYFAVCCTVRLSYPVCEAQTSVCKAVLQYVAVCCSMLQYVAVCCSMLQYAAV